MITRGPSGMQRDEPARQVEPKPESDLILVPMLAALVVLAGCVVAGIWSGPWQWYLTGPFGAFVTFGAVLLLVDPEMRRDRGMLSVAAGILGAVAALIAGVLATLWTGQWLWLITGFVLAPVIAVAGLAGQPATGKHSKP